MRLNRVLLLAASINMAMLAITFTISCSGSDGSSGQPGQPGTQCVVEDGNFVCDGVVIGPIGGGPNGLDCDFNALGQLVCNGQIIGDEADNCNISTVGTEGASALMVDCGAGGRFGMCGNDVFLFEEKFCDYGTVRANLVCSGDEGNSLPGYKGANPNLGEACDGGSTSGETKYCNIRDNHYWSVSTTPGVTAGIYSCKLSPKYRECGAGDDLVVFEVGDSSYVWDHILKNEGGATPDLDSLNIFDRATRICKNGELAACPAGWIPKVPTVFATGAFFETAPSECQPAVDHAICYGLGSDTVGVFNARTSVCENRGTENARIKACEITVQVYGGQPEYSATYNPYEPFLETTRISGKTGKEKYAYEKCELNSDFRECIDNGKEVKSVFFKKNYVCKNYGNSNPTIEECKNGMTPNAMPSDLENPLGWTACIDGATQCRDRSGYFHTDNICYYSRKQACYARNFSNKNANGGYDMSCVYDDTGKKWYENDGGTTECDDDDDGSIDDVTSGDGVGTWTAEEDGDKYWFEDACYNNARAVCELGDGLWTDLDSPNKDLHNNTDICTDISSLNQTKCFQLGFFWGNLISETAATSKSCTRTEDRAKLQCEEVVGVSDQSGPGKNIHSYVWIASTKRCQTMTATYATKTSCENAGFYWDPRVYKGKCFKNVDEARTECRDNETLGVWNSGICTGAASDGTCAQTTPAFCESRGTCDAASGSWTPTTPAKAEEGTCTDCDTVPCPNNGTDCREDNGAWNVTTPAVPESATGTCS